ncbi:type II CAAX endopeptidase family protein [Microbacterium oryzae]|nr:type II CAAX endopeptidase family protein [Microbacterium oryzae]MDN3309707.1 type II CAAX endopeptidase family protein [Microbacterium oryzae]
MTAVCSTSVDRRRLGWEIAIVLALSLGQSALYSVLSLLRALLRPEALADQATALNPARAEEPAWDVVYRLLDIGFDLCLVALVVYLLWEPGRSALRGIGLDLRSLPRDLGRAAILLVVIGVPGIALYVGARLLGLNVDVQASSGIDGWLVPVLVLSALRAGLLEEVILGGYLFDRLGRVGWRPWTIILAVAGLRAAYHAYQGFGAIIGNFAMGVVFGWCYRRWGRVMPLVLAHALIDVFAFVGYPLVAPFLP